LGRLGHTGQRILLSENPAAFSNRISTASLPAINLPQPTSFGAFEATRSNFLNLSKTLAATTNPLVVVAWGHGGRQGSVPVFHVRGERLRPEDFQAFADAFSGQATRWVLLFRGSGAFARQLAGQKRWTLSSESEASFTSDPIGMSVLLKL